MKRYVLIALLLVTTILRAQNFEGVITWTVQFTMADTALNKGMAFVFPSQVTLNAAGKNWLLGIWQGEMKMESIWAGDSNHYYRLNRKAKTYSLFAPGGRPVPDSLQQVAENTGETMVIHGYGCNKYIVHLNRRDTSMQQIFWVTTAIHINGMDNLRAQGGEPIFYKNMEGVPLRVEIISRDMNLIIAATQIQKGAQAAGNVSIPADFTAIKN